MVSAQQSAIRYLEFLRESVTGARRLSTPIPEHEREYPEKDIFEGLALELFLHHQERTQDWVVAIPERFFMEPSKLPSVSVVQEGTC